MLRACPALVEYTLVDLFYPLMARLAGHHSAIAADSLYPVRKRTGFRFCEVFAAFGAAGWSRQKMEEEECLWLLPTLAHFELVDPCDALQDHFLAVLVDAPHLLPNLSMRVFYVPDPSFYPQLLNALMARRTQIRTARFTCDHTAFRDFELPPEVVVQLHQLGAGGMDLHIGTREKSYIRGLLTYGAAVFESGVQPLRDNKRTAA
ncbi:hypothetical protein FB451DRAFT_772091 [Mycena latifolia]|nr:hypothetical protein FB451DRAFT_772091 [Mycena latifolia]